MTRTTAKQAAEAMRLELVEITGLSPEYMYVLTAEPNDKGMTLATHGWAGEDGEDGGYAELCAEEAYGYFDAAIEALIGRGLINGEKGAGFDYVQTGVLCFYDG